MIDLAWSIPPNPPEPIQDAYAQLCQASCGARCRSARRGGAQITAPAAGTYTVRVWLTDTAGRGSSANAATTTVTVPAARPDVTTTTTTTTTATVPVKTPTSASCKACPSRRSSEALLEERCAV